MSLSYDREGAIILAFSKILSFAFHLECSTILFFKFSTGKKDIVSEIFN